MRDGAQSYELDWRRGGLFIGHLVEIYQRIEVACPPNELNGLLKFVLEVSDAQLLVASQEVCLSVLWKIYGGCWVPCWKSGMATKGPLGMSMWRGLDGCSTR
ncbi:hypothetical protein Misp06_00866 [Microbulbifer sp. NBRC 101763]